MANNKKRKNSNYKRSYEDQEKKDKRKNRIILIVGILIAVLAVGGIIAAIISSSSSSEPEEEMGTGACEYLETRDTTGRDIKYVEMCVDGYGKLVILLDATTAPKTVANFISLVEDGFYDGLTFHRVIGDFMIQGGDPLGNGIGGSDEEIKGEFASNGHYNDIKHKYGVISMARSGGNASNNYGYDSASSQFFICNADSYSVSNLDGRYAAFGYVVQGMSVVDEITNDYKKYDGVIKDKSKQPVIEYIKVLDSWEKP